MLAGQVLLRGGCCKSAEGMVGVGGVHLDGLEELEGGPRVAEADYTIHG
jgi:hypothetical protein